MTSSEDGSLLSWTQGEVNWGGKAGERLSRCTVPPCSVVCSGHRCKHWQQKGCSPQSSCPAWFRAVYRCSLPVEESRLLMEDLQLPTVPWGREASVQLQWNWCLSSLKWWVRELTHSLVWSARAREPLAVGAGSRGLWRSTGVQWLWHGPDRGNLYTEPLKWMQGWFPSFPCHICE